MLNFSLNQSQFEKAQEWMKQHDCSLKKAQTAIGGKTTYCFTPTNLGVVEKIKCACGQELDVSDYDAW